MPAQRTQANLSRSKRQRCKCSKCIASNPQGRLYNRSTVWRHQHLDNTHQRNRLLFTCRDCGEEHQVPADEIDAHRREVSIRMTMRAPDPLLPANGTAPHNAVIDGTFAQTYCDTQDIPDFSSVIEDEEYNHNNLSEDELQFQELLEDFAMAEDLPESVDEWTFAQDSMRILSRLSVCADLLACLSDPNMHFQVEFRKWVTQNKLPREQYIKLRNLMQTSLGIALPSIRGQTAYLQNTTEIQPQFIDCCQSGCMAFTGQFASLRSCTFCGSSRYREEDSVNPIQQYLYIPLAKRLEIQYSDCERSKVLKEYRTTLLRTYKEGQYRDVWDGNLFREYHKKLGLFKSSTDVGLQLSLDGVQVVRRKNFLVTPIILLNLNLPPSERVRTRNILISTLIPGPQEPKNLDSFLYPLVQEMHMLGKGIPGVIDGQYLSGTAGYKFTLRAWITTVTGDGPATAKAMGFKNPGNAKAPCRMCYQQAQRSQTSNTYYMPHHGIFSGFDMRNNARRDIQLCVEADNNDTYSQWGITRKSILTELRSIHFPRSFPIDIMHCILLNITPLLFRLWIGKVSGVDENEDDKPAYRLSSKDLSSIGDTLVNAVSTIPASLGHAPRHIGKHYNGFKAAEWKAWLTLYGVPCLRPYLPDRYLQNFVVLGHLFALATKQQLSQSEVDLTGDLCTSFLQSYELLYYQNNKRRMKLCTVNFHYLVHLRQHLMDAGPACYWWQFPMERYCGIIVPMARSKSRISQSLMNALVITEHLNHYPFVIPAQLSEKTTPPLPYLTTPISKPVDTKTRSKQPSWRSDIYRKYKRPSEDLEPLHIEFYLKCQLSVTTSIGCASQTRRVNSRANWVVCYSDKRHGLRFGEVEIFALVNGKDAWARIEHLGSSPPSVDRKRRLCSYKGPRGKLVWAPVSCIHAAAGIIALDRHYCITDYDIYAQVQST